MVSSKHHVSVLLDEVIDLMPVVDNGIYVDCTLGMGGHTKALLNKIPKSAQVICFDKDSFAIDNFKTYLNQHKIQNVMLIHDDFKNLKQHLLDLKIDRVNGIMFDLGVSSPQLDNADRGFSYHLDAPLDMRMNQAQELSAFTVVNTYPLEKLITIFKRYGESPYAVKVAQAIIKAREIKPIATTLELVDVIKNALPAKELHKNKHPAKVFFQAIRIEVNQELDNLANTILDASSVLNSEGVLSVISFHSLEDKIVKECFKKLTTSNIPSYVPTTSNDIEFKYLLKQTPKDTELENNIRARSAKVRVIQRKESHEK